MPTLRSSGATHTRASVTVRPCKAIEPVSGRSRPAIRRSSVVLPQPLGPTITIISAGDTASPPRGFRYAAGAHLDRRGRGIFRSRGGAGSTADSSLAAAAFSSPRGAAFMTQPSSILELKDVCKTFDQAPRPVIGPISLAVRAGEMMVIVGPSGCGKTTLLRLIAGLERLDTGSIALHGRTVTDARVWVAPEERNVGMVFQDFSLFPHLTVEQNVRFGLNPFSETESRHAINLVRQFGLSELLARYPHQLSGGEQQRCALARALAQRPAVVLFAEPFSNLDAGLRPRMRRELKKNLRELGTTGLFVTHDRFEALEIADRVAVLRDGFLEQLDSPEVVYQSPATAFVAEFVSDADFLNGKIKDNALETELGTHSLPASVAKRLTAGYGASVDVMVRPEDIELQPIEPGEEGAACARVVLRQFRGSEVLLTVRLASGKELRAEGTAAVSLSEGAEVRVGLRSLAGLFYRGRRIR